MKGRIVIYLDLKDGSDLDALADKLEKAVEADIPEGGTFTLDVYENP